MISFLVLEAYAGALSANTKHGTLPGITLVFTFLKFYALSPK